jgi:hypothetical protein
MDDSFSFGLTAPVWNGNSSTVRLSIVLPFRFSPPSHRGTSASGALRTFAHAYETGALRHCTCVAKETCRKELRVQAAACNLAWLLRKLMEAGTPRALLDLVAGLFLVLLRLISTGRVDSQRTHPFGTAIPHR